MKFGNKRASYDYERANYDHCLLLCLQVQETLQSKVYTKVTSFNMYPNF